MFLCFQVRLLKGCSILYWVHFCLLLDWQEVFIFMLKRNWPAMYGGSTEISVFYMKSEFQNLFSSWCQNCVSISDFFKCNNWLALIKNIWAKDKRKYYLNYYLPHWGQKKFKQLFFWGLRGVIYVLFWQITLFIVQRGLRLKFFGDGGTFQRFQVSGKRFWLSNFMSCS